MYSEVLIVGGGPSGAACAIKTSRNGLETAIFESGNPFRDKPCGDGLTFSAQRALGQLGVLDDVQKHGERVEQAVIYGQRGERIVIKSPFLTIQRSTLDQILRDKAEENDARLVYNTRIVQAEVNDKEVRVKDEKGTWYEGKVLVLATGAVTKLAHSLGFNFEKPSAVAVRGYMPNKNEIKDYLFFLFKDIPLGYGWIFPSIDNMVNVGVIYYKSHNPKKDLSELLNYFVGEIASKYLRDCEFIARPHTWQLRTGLTAEQVSGNRVLLAGENLGCTYDLSGEGISSALESGIVAGELIREVRPNYSSEQLSSYKERIKNAVGLFHKGYTKAMKIMGNSFYNFVFTRLLSNSQPARHIMERVINGEMTPQELFSLNGFLRSIK